MRLTSILLALFLSARVLAGAATYTELTISPLVPKESDFEFGLNDALSITISDGFRHWSEEKSLDVFRAETHVLLLPYSEGGDTGHIIHVQVVRLTPSGEKLFPTTNAWIDFIDKTTASRRTTYQSRPVDPLTIMERTFEGKQYLSTINGSVEEGVFLAHKRGNVITVVRVQELDRFRDKLSWLLQHAMTLHDATPPDRPSQPTR